MQYKTVYHQLEAESALSCPFCYVGSLKVRTTSGLVFNKREVDTEKRNDHMKCLQACLSSMSVYNVHVYLKLHLQFVVSENDAGKSDNDFEDSIFFAVITLAAAGCKDHLRLLLPCRNLDSECILRPKYQF
jgi:hypothetical protein